MTQGPDDEKEQVTAIQKEYSSQDVLLILGGDGTLSKTLNHWPSHFPFAYYPTGSGNDFARALQLPSLSSLMESILTKRTQDIYVLDSSLGTIVNSVDLGFAARVVQLSSHSRLKSWLNKVKLGKLTYVFFAVRSLLQRQAIDLTVTLDDYSYRLDNLFFFSIANSRYFGGGITIWPKASFLEPNLDLVYFDNSGLLKRIAVLLALLFHRQEQSTSIHHLSGRELTLSAQEPYLAQVDGEVTRLKEVTIIPQKRTIYL